MTIPFEVQIEKCPLCKLPEPMGVNAQRLYGGWVCTSCAGSFADRRRIAFFVDWMLFGLIYELLIRIADHFNPTMVTAIFDSGFLTRLAANSTIAMVLCLKDGLAGKSIGRALTGITVVDETTRRPIGPWASLKRNLCLLVPITIFVLFFTLMKGKRWGDGWAKTRVIWDRYKLAYPFEDRQAVCYLCQYDLKGNTSGVCPECGVRIPESW